MVGPGQVGDQTVSGRDAPPLAQKLLSLALLTLVACWALNEAAHLLLAVWQVLVAVGALVLIGAVVWRSWVQRRSGW